MTQIDQFESLFNSAAKEVFQWRPPPLATVLLVSDLADYEAHQFTEQVQIFLSALGEEVEWVELHGAASATVGGLLDAVERTRPDLVVTYRNLHTGAWRWPYSLGDQLDVLTQVTTTPVLVLPRPDDACFTARVVDTNRVMALTDHIAGDARLVNYAAAFTEHDGRLYLAHVEDEAVFERYIGIIGKIPTLDTDEARRRVRDQLIKEAEDYADSCREVLSTERPSLEVESVVRMGHRTTTYKALVAEHALDLLVIYTKDAAQLAMHGSAYPLLVELRDVAILAL